MNTESGKENISNLKREDNIVWDNDNETYGHIASPSSFKRKDLPSEEHQHITEHVDNDKIHADLKNTELSSDTDIGNRNSKNEKRIRGEDA